MHTDARLRRYEYDLMAAGLGAFMFGAWTALKAVLMFLLRRTTADELDLLLDRGGLEGLIAVILLIIVVVVIVAIHAFVFLCARSEGLGKKKRYVYIGVAAVLALIKIPSIWSDARTFSFIPTAIADEVITICVDITGFIIFLNVVLFAILVKKYRKRLEKEGAECR